jgi:hypothetical protein
MREEGMEPPRKPGRHGKVGWFKKRHAAMVAAPLMYGTLGRFGQKLVQASAGSFSQEEAAANLNGLDLVSRRCPRPYKTTHNVS